MSVPQPPRITQPLTTIDALAQTISSFQQWATQLWNGVRPSVLQMEKIAEIPLIQTTIGNPPTQAQVNEIKDTLNAVITAARTKVSGQ
jgi:hypothetical protein